MLLLSFLLLPLFAAVSAAAAAANAAMAAAAASPAPAAAPVAFGSSRPSGLILQTSAWAADFGAESRFEKAFFPGVDRGSALSVALPLRACFALNLTRTY